MPKIFGFSAKCITTTWQIWTTAKTRWTNTGIPPTGSVSRLHPLNSSRSSPDWVRAAWDNDFSSLPGRSDDIAPDGERFLMIKDGSNGEAFRSPSSLPPRLFPVELEQGQVEDLGSPGTVLPIGPLPGRVADAVLARHEDHADRYTDAAKGLGVVASSARHS